MWKKENLRRRRLYATKKKAGSQSARSQSTLRNGERLEERIVLNAAPVLDDTASPALLSIAEDAGAPSGQVGTFVSSLIDTGGTHTNFSDTDGDLPGIAITGVNLQGGALWYSSDNGSTWLDVGAVSDEVPRLLAADATTRVYFEPAADFTGTVSDVISFKAWDRNVIWQQMGLDIDGEVAGDLSGNSVSLSADGQTVAIGDYTNDDSAIDAGQVRVYSWTGSSWSQLGADINGEAAGDLFGNTVSLAADGQTVAIGAYLNDGNGTDSGHVRIYSWDGSGWIQLGEDIDGEAADDRAGIYLALSDDGQTLAVGAWKNDGNGTDSGHVRIFSWNGATWVQLGNDINGEAGHDWSGSAVSLSDDGQTLAVGAWKNDGNGTNSGHVRIYSWNGSSWSKLGADIDGEAAADHLGCSASLSADGQIVAIGAKFNDGNGSSSGHVRIYSWNGSTWNQLGTDIDGEFANDQSGQSVSLSADGQTLAIGSRYNDGNGTDSGHFRIYSWDGSAWSQLGSDIDGEGAGDEFGVSISLADDGATVAIGGRFNDGNGPDSGHVRIFQRVPSLASVSTVNDTISVTVELVGDLPVLDLAGSPQLDLILEDADSPVGQVGTLVSKLIDTSGLHNNFSDVDFDLPGIAITGVSLQGGALWYSSDNGSTWLDVGSVSDEAPRLLAADATTRVYFEPAADFSGTVSDVISFKAWDRTKIWQQLGEDIDGEGTDRYTPDHSGRSVAISSDGQIVAIGARYNDGNGVSSGHVRVFQRSESGWNQVGEDIDGEAAGDYSGYRLSISADGLAVAIGAYGNDGNGDQAGHVRVFTWNGSAWGQLGTDIDGEASLDYSGWSVALSSDGQTVAIGGYGNDGNGGSSGHVRIYSWDGASWGQVGLDIDGEEEGDCSGWSVALAADGQTVAIGAQYNDENGEKSGHTRIFQLTGASWLQLGADINGEASEDESGWSVSLSGNGQTVAIGARYNDANGRNSGHTRIYTWTGSAWSQLGEDIDGEAADDQSGYSVALSSDGQTVAIGAPGNDGNGSGSGHVRIYSWNGSSWSKLGSDINGESQYDFSGDSVSLSADGQTVAVGAPYNDGNVPDSGHVRVFQLVPSVSTTTDTLGITVESVNDTPVWAPVTVSTNEDTTKVITLNATDVDSTTLTYAVTSQPSHGTVSIVNDKATYVPNTNFYGTDSFVVMVSDNHPTQPKATTALVTVNVDAVNDVPLLDALSDTTISEDAAEQTVSLAGINTGASEDQPLRVTATSDNAGLIPDPTVTYTSPNATGSIAFTPVADEHGSATITVTVEDGGLDQNLATSEDNATVSQTFTVTVVSVMDRPVLDATASPQLVPVIEDSGVPVGAIGTRVSDLVNTGGVVGNFSDVDGHLAGIAITAVNPNGVLWCSFDNGARWSQAVGVSEATPRLLVATSSSRLYFEPNDDFSGSITDAITFRAWDRTDSGWSQLGSDINGESGNDDSGYSVSLSADGQTVAIGAYGNDGNGSGSGHVRIYSWTGSSWSKRGADIDGELSSDYSGYSVSLSADGQTVAIGARLNDGDSGDINHNSGHVRVYSWNGSGWSKLGADIDGESQTDYSGHSVSLSANGQTVAIGAINNDGNGSNSGHVRIYSWTGSSWSKLGADIDGESANDSSGQSVSLSADGQTVAIGAAYNGNRRGHVRIYSWTGSSWSKRGADIDGESQYDYSGHSVSLSADGQTVAIGAYDNHGNGQDSGHVRIYSWTGSAWSKLGADIDGEAQEDESGRSVSLSADGRTIAIGAPRDRDNGYFSGHVRIYSWTGSSWSKLGADIDGEAAYDYSGSSVSLSADGQTVAIGAPDNDGNGSNSGHVRIYRLKLDSSVSLATDTAGLNVVPLNDWPVLSDVTATTDEEVPVEITLEANDVDSGSFTYAVTGDPANGTVSLVGNVATYTPATDFYGTDTFTVTVSDNHPTNPNTDTATVTVTVANLDNETSPWGYPLLPNPQGNWVHSSGTAPVQSPHWVPSNLPSAESLTIHGYATHNDVSNDNGVVFTGKFSQPTSADNHYYVFETYVFSDVTQDLNWRLAGSDGHSLFLDGVFEEGAFGGSLRYGTLPLVAGVPVKVSLVSYNHSAATSPYVQFSQYHPFGSSASLADIRNIEDVSGVTISAESYFRAPTLDPISSVTIAEDASQQVISLTGISAGANETQSLRVTASSSDPSLIPDPTPTYTSPDATGSIAFTPRTEQHGTATISVTVEDGGLDNDLATVGDNRTTTQTFDVTVTPVNDLPVLDSAATPQLDWVLANVGAPTGQVGTLVSKLIETDGLHNNFSDVDGDLPGIAITGVNLQGGSLWYSSDDGATWLDVGAVSDEAPRLLAADATTRVYFEPAADFTGTVSDVISFKAWDRTKIWQQLGLDIDGEESSDLSSYVSTSADGQTIAIGGRYNSANGLLKRGHVRIYSWTGSSWSQLGADIDGEAAGDQSGISVSLSDDGQTVAIGAYRNDGSGSDSGHVRIYSWDGSGWSQLGEDIDGEAVGDNSGARVRLSGDGLKVAIGAIHNAGNGSNSGHVRIYSWNGSGWIQLGEDIDGEAEGDSSGYSLAISADGQTIAIGAHENDGNGSSSGHVRVYSWDGSAWNQVGVDLDGEEAGDQSGTSVSLSADGQTVAIGATLNDGSGSEAGQVRIYSWDGSAWNQVGVDLDGEEAGDRFGYSVVLAADGQTVAIGSRYNDGNGSDSGHVRIYSWDGSAWIQLSVDIDGEASGDQSGLDVSLSADGQIVAIGAYLNDGNGPDSGHVRVFQRVPSVSTTTDTLGITVESVNDTPVWPPVTVSTNEDTTKVITLNATDVDSTTLTYAVTSQPSHGTVSIVNDKATYVPNTNFYGTDSFVVMVSDNHPTQPKATTALVTVNVDAVNDVPLLDALSDTTISEDAAEQTVSLAGINTGASEDQPLRVTATSDNAGLIPDPTVTYTSPNATGSIAFTPVADEHGSATITVTVEDGGLDQNLATSEDNATVSQTFTVTVVSVMDRPVLDATASPQLVPVIEDSGVPVGAIGTRVSDLVNTGGVVGNFSDVDGHLAGIAITAVNPNGVLWCSFDNGARWSQAVGVSEATPRLLVATSSSRLYFEPNDDFSGSITDAITFRAWDRTDSGWSQLGSDINGESGNDDSGYSVSLSADGQTVAIGAYGNDGNGSGSGHVRIYSWTGSSWSKRGADIDGELSSDYSGYSVSLSADGQTVAIGARLNDGDSGDINHNSGHVRVYSWNGSGWSKLGADIDGESQTDYSGHSVSLSANGQTVAIGAINNDGNGSNSGHVRIYSWTGSSWSKLGADIDGESANDSSGQSVSLSADGQTVAIGAAYNGNRRGHVRIYSWTGSSWSKRGADIDGESQYDYSGHSVSLSADGQTVAIGAYDNHGNGQDSGHVRIYSWTGSAWSKLGADIDGEAQEDESGRSVSLSADGRTIAIGAPRDRDNGYFSGHVRIYSWTGSSWSKLGADIDGEAAYDYSGSSVSLSADGQTVAIGAPDNDGNGSNSGHVRIYRLKLDSSVSLATDTAGLNVVPLNDWPVLSDVTATTDEEVPVEITLEANDVDSGSFTYAVTGDPANGTVSLVGNVATYTPATDFYGTDTFTVTVSDNHPTNPNTDTATVTVNVANVNDQPALNELVDLSISEDAGEQTVFLDGISSGSGETQVLSVTAVSDNPGLIPDPTVTYASPDATGSIAFTPVADQFGTATITVTLEDGGIDNNISTPEDNGSILRTVTVIVAPVNDEPTLDVLPDVNLTEDDPEQVVSLTGISAGGDETQVVSVTAVSDNPGLIPNPTVTYTTADTTGSIALTPVADAHGTATITVTLEDGGPDDDLGTSEDNGLISRTVVVNVAPVNDLPTLAIEGAFGSQFTGGAQTAPNGYPLEEAEEGNWLYSSGPSGTASTTYYPTTLEDFSAVVDHGYVSYYTEPGDTTVGRFTPPDSSSGQYHVFETYAISDVEQTVSYWLRGNDGVSLFVDDVFVSGGGFGVENTGDITFQAGVARKIVLAGHNGASETNVTFRMNGGSLEDVSGLYTSAVTRRVQNSSEQTVSMTGIAAGGGETQELRITAVSDSTNLIPDPTVDLDSQSSTGSLKFTPVGGQSGVVVITVTAEDGGLDNDLATPEDNGVINRTVIVAVAPENDEPTLDAASEVNISEDDPEHTINLTGISAGVGETQVLSVTAVSDNTSLIPDPTVTYDGQSSTGTLTFTPVADQSGTATITVTVTDGGLDNDLGTPEDNGIINRTIVVRAEAVNDAPTLDALSDVDINEDASEQTISLTGIAAGGGETQGLSVTAVSDNTSLILDPTVTFDGQSTTGTLKFTPVADQSGTATLTVTVTDGGLDNNLATPEDNGVINRTVIVRAEAVNDAPVLDAAASPQLASVLEDSGAPSGQVGSLVSDLIDTGGTHNNFSDIDGDSPGIAITGVNLQGGRLWYSIDDGATWIDVGAVSDAVPRLLAADAITRLYFQPTANFNGTISDVISFKAWDRMTAGWQQLGLDIDGEAAGDRSGNSISLSLDGQTVAIAAYLNDGTGGTAGHVRIYRWNDSAWHQLGSDIDGEAAGDESGASVSLSADGQTVAIGANSNDGNGTDAGHVRVYRWDGSVWNQLGSDIDGELIGDRSGLGVAISADGQTVAIGAEGNDGNGADAGHVRIYQWNDSVWQQLGNDIDGEAAGDESGRRVSVSGDGYTVAIGARYNDSNGANSGHVRIYQWSGIDWQQVGVDINGEYSGDESGFDVSLSSDGQTVAISAWKNDGNGFDSGHVRVFEWSGSSWLQLGNDIDGEASRDDSGRSLALSSNGKIIVIGATHNDGNGNNSGHVRIYSWNGSSWSKLGEDIDGEASEDYSGLASALSADGQTVAISAWSNAGNGTDSGHVRIFRLAPAPDSLSTATDTISVTVDPQNDAPSGSVTVDGVAEEDQVLTATNDLADIDGLGVIAYEWSRDGAPISGTTASTYTLTQDDVGSTITATTRYTDNDGTVETVTSSATSAVLNVNDVPTGDVTIDGSATQNAVLSANTSTVQDEDGLGAFAYQWLRDGVLISAATSSTYTLTQDDVDSQISVQVDYTDNEATAESLTSAQTSVVVNVNDAPVLGGNRTIHYPDFSDTTGLIFEGRAAQYGDVLRVHDNTPNTNGVIEFDGPVQVLDGFETDFTFRVGDEMTSSGADNLSFAMYGRDGQRADPWARHSLHFMIDTWNNPEHEFDENNWSLQIIGQSPDLVPNSAKGGYVFHVVPLPGVKDTELHDVQIAYDPKIDSLVVTFDDVEILSTDSQEIGSFLQTLLEQVDAGVSIWASSGGVSETHDIHSWSFTSLTPPALNAVVEDAGVPVGTVGTLVSNLLGNRFSDVDGDLPGIAITETNLQGGSLWYSIDDGATWLDVGAVSDEAPRLLAADVTTRVYFEPAADFSGSISDVISFKAWDRNGIWQQFGLDIDGEAVEDQSGFSVSLSSDGQTVAIGAHLNDGNGLNSGHTRIYHWTGSAWTQLGEDIDGEAANDNASRLVSLSTDGLAVAIGAFFNDGNGTSSGHTRIYRWTGSAWTQLGADIDGEAAVDLSGFSVSLSSDGQAVAIGAHFNDGNGSKSGHTRIYRWTGSSWTQVGADIDGEAAGDNSGRSVSLSSDGQTVAVGAYINDGNGLNSGHTRIYRWTGSAWTQLGEDIDGEAVEDQSGFSVSLASDGQTVAIGARFNDGDSSDINHNSGHVRIYSWNGSVWTKLGADIDGEAATDHSGHSVSLSADGQTVAIGAHLNDGNGLNSGHTRIYRWTGSAWSQLGANIDGEAAGDLSGFSGSLSSDGQTVAIGAYNNDGNGTDSGHVHIFQFVPSVSTVTDTISVTVNAVNDAPTLDLLSDRVLPEDSPTQIIDITGITAGGGETQPLQMTVTSSNPSLISEPTITSEAVSVEGSRSLAFVPLPDQYGITTITVTVEDGGLDLDLNTAEDNAIFSRTFDVTVTPDTDNPPSPVTPHGRMFLHETLRGDSLVSYQLPAVNVNGEAINDLPTRVTMTSSNTALIPDPTVLYASADVPSSLSFTPVASANGTATLSIQVEDGGPDNDFATTEDNRQATHQVVVNVLEVISNRVSAILAKDNTENLYVNTQPVVYHDQQQQAQSNIAGFAAIGATSEGGENALLVERASVTNRLVTDDAWRINGLFHSLQNESSPVLDLSAREVSVDLNVVAVAGAYEINGARNPTLVVRRGQIYNFNLNVANHPFYLQTTGNGFHPENAFNKFFQGQGRTEGEYMWIVPADAPDELYYQCEFHPVMFGKIIIVD